MGKEKIKFSLSPSSIGNYMESQLLFYWNNIERIEPDTWVPTCYGKGGNVVHLAIEKYLEDGGSIGEYFEQYWQSHNLDRDKGINGKPLSKAKYLEAATRGFKVAKTLQNANPEEKIKFLIHEDDTFKIYATGIIDVQYEDEDGLHIVDWKTSSSIDTSDRFETQAKHYAYLIWKTKGIVVKSATFEYVKINKRKTYTYTEECLKEYEEKFFKPLLNEIIQKGTDINNYEIGDVSSIFNDKKKACDKEVLRRAKTQQLEVEISYNKMKFVSPIPEKLQKAMDIKYSYDVPGAVFSDLYRKKIWDGKKHLFRYNALPLAYKNHFENLVKEFNKYYSCNYKIHYKDLRNELVMNTKADITYKNPEIELRYYQEDAINVALKKKFAILHLGTSAGKTFIAAELLKKLSKRALLIVNRVELARQTHKEFEEYLGVPVGLLTEGTITSDKLFSVASVQTLTAVLKRGTGDPRRKELVKLLYNTPVCIYDECHLLSDSKSYSLLAKFLPNVTHSIGLTGTPFRTDQADLEMNSLVGFVEYTKSTRELQEEGYITESSAVFLKTIYKDLPIKRAVMGEGERMGTIPEIDVEDDSFAEKYSRYIVENEPRNEEITNLCQKLSDKKILILISRVNHGKVLKELLPEAFVIQGATSKEDRKQIFEEFQTADSGIIIGSAQIMSTGINLPSLDIIINATANKSDVVTLQTVGRVLRKAKNKTHAYFIDFTDSGTPFSKNSSERQRTLEAFGHKLVQKESVDEIVKYINTTNN